MIDFSHDELLLLDSLLQDELEKRAEYDVSNPQNYEDIAIAHRVYAKILSGLAKGPSLHQLKEKVFREIAS